MGKLDFFGAVATLVGCIIGAGIFAIPYAISKAGFLLGFIILVIIGLATLLMNLYVGEICLRTEGNHTLATLAKKYIGKKGEYAMIVALMVGVFGGHIAYILGSGKTISAIFGIDQKIGSLIFVLSIATVLFFNINFLERIELIFVAFIGILIFTIFGMSVSNVQIANLADIHTDKFLLPFGVILFAYSGIVAISEMKEELGEKNKHLLKNAIIVGSLIPMIIYTIFAMLVIGVTGQNTTPVATIGLGNLLGDNILIIGNLFVIFAMATSYLTSGFAIKELFIEEFKMNKNFGWFLVMLVPAIVAFSGFTSFFTALSFTGALATGSLYLLALSMHKKAKDIGELSPHFNINSNIFIKISLITIILFGMGYQVFSIVL